jgi:hypothetical protein
MTAVLCGVYDNAMTTWPGCSYICHARGVLSFGFWTFLRNARVTHLRRPPLPRKRLVSIRLDSADVERIRRIGDRLQARESDVFRFALALAFSRLAPLSEGSLRGADLLPLLLDHGPELIRHFNLDAPRLAAIVNGGANSEQAIDARDIELLAMQAVPDRYLHARMHALTGAAGEQDTVAQLRNYFYRKYFATARDEAVPSEDARAVG